MAKTKSVYVCQNCGAQSPRWQGRCNDCECWNTLAEEVLESQAKLSGMTLNQGAGELFSLDQVLQDQSEHRPTGLGELDRVLGGGLVNGSVLLLGGPPGIGKSTLLLQLASSVSKELAPVLYVSGEESHRQIRLRADRLETVSPAILVFNETRLEAIEEQIENCQPKLLLVDSVQTLFRSDLSSAPGSVTQVRECASALMRIAKRKQVSTILVGHVTKDGGLAGPRVLEHLVDTVLSFEGEADSQVRVLRSSKNRFGPTHELGLFEMGPKGLTPVLHPSTFFLKSRAANLNGTTVTPALEGTRPILVELQALVTESYAAKQGAPPIRRSVGLDGNRLSLLLAVLGKRLKESQFGKNDVYAKISGGLNLVEPALDLALSFALLSSVLEQSLPSTFAAFGEVGLGGELRPVPGSEIRLRELERMGFLSCALPTQSVTLELRKNMELELIPLENIDQVPMTLRKLGISENS